MSFLDLDELVDDSLHINKKTLSVYENILSKIYNKIKMVNKKKILYMKYTVPYYVFGYGVYDIKSCITYLILSLRKKGIFVKYKNPNILLIYWGNLVKNHYKKMVEKKYYYDTEEKSNIYNQYDIVRKQNININTNINKINDNLINNYKKEDTNKNNLLNDKNIDNLIEMSKYI